MERAGVQLIACRAHPAAVISGDAVFLAAVHTGLADAVVLQDVVPEVLNDGFQLRILHASFDAVDDLGLVSIGPDGAGEAPFTALPLTLEDELDALTGPVGFAFVDGKHDIDFEAAICR